MAIVFEDGTSTTHNGSFGNDFFFGGIGSDNYSGGFGGDVFNMAIDRDRDTVSGGDGVDSLSYASADQAVRVALADTGVGSVMSDFVFYFSRGADGSFQPVYSSVEVAQVSGIENVTGTRLDDTLQGNSSNNTLDGRESNDTLDGRGGTDILIGGLGADTLTGGESSDSFVFNTVTDSRFVGTPEYADLDVITDFKYGQDKIDLSRIDADTTVSGNQTFAFATGAFTGEAGELRTYWGGTGRILQGDTNGDAVADFTLMVKGLTLYDMHQAPTSADFIL